MNEGQDRLSCSGEGESGGSVPRDARGGLGLPAHGAEELRETLVGGLWTAPHLKKKVWQRLVWDLGALPCTGRAAGRGGLGAGSSVLLFVWSRVN